MVRYFIVFIGVSLLGGPAPVQAVPQSTTDQAAILNSAQGAVARALNYDQGDSRSLIDAENDFTVDGWREFMKRMDGWLDDKGAPQGSSHFTSMGETVVKIQQNGVVRLIIPGVLKQEVKNAYGGISSSTYRVVIDVQAVSNPFKIVQLETRTCGGTTTAASCQ